MNWIRCALACAGALVLGLAQAQVQGAPRYRVQALPDWPQGWSPGSFRDLNNAGDVVGYANRLSSDRPGPFLFSSGRLAGVDISAIDGQGGEARFINDRGQIAMDLQRRGGARNEPWLLSNGSFINLVPGYDGSLGSGYGTVNGLNEAGHAVGKSNHQLFYFDGTTSRYLDLGLAERDVVSASAINGHDAIAGQVNFANRTVQAFIYEDGRLTFLQGLRSVIAFNDANQAVGISSDGTAVLLRNRDGSLADLGFFLTDINNQGWIVGFGPSPYLYRDGTTYDLNELLLPRDDPRWTLNTVYSINDAGQILGLGTQSNGAGGWFLASPVPEPPLQALMLCGAVLLGWAARRRST